jgi:hypothetical protein
MKFLTLLLTCVLVVVGKPQTYAQQLMPGQACLLANNQVLLASTAYEYFYTQKKLALSFYNQQGEIQKKQLLTIDTLSVEKIGGVFQHNDSTLVVFCVFASINNLQLPTYWGYVLLNNQWQVQSYNLLTIWFSDNNLNPSTIYPYMVDFLRIKRDSQGQYFGNVGAKRNYNKNPLLLYLSNDYIDPQYNNWVRLSPQLELINNFPDTGFAYETFAGFESFMGEGSGDIEETSTGYLTMVGIITSSPGQMYTNILHKDSFTKNKHTSGGWTIRDFIDPRKVPTYDTGQYINNHTPFFYAKKLSPSSTLVGLSGQFNQYRRVEYDIVSDTGGIYKSDRGFILKLNDTAGVVNYVYDIPADTETFIGINNPARQQSLDFYTPNNIYFAQTEDVSNLFLPQAWNRIWVTLVDSNLNKKWVKCITHPNRDIPNREYIQEHLIAQTILATPDGGCLVFASIAYQHFTDTSYYQDAAFDSINPYWQTIVYKLMPDGTLTTGNAEHQKPQQEVLIYPNPTSHYINIAWPDISPLTCELTNLQGQLVLNQTTNMPHKLDVSGITNGVYLLKITSNKNTTVFKKVIINH